MPSKAKQAISKILQDAIDATELDRLKIVLRAICDELPDAKRILERELIVEVESDNASLSIRDNDSHADSESDEQSEDDASVGDESEDSEEDEPTPKKRKLAKTSVSSSKSAPQDKKSSATAKAAKKGKKRARARYALCENCREEYDVEENLHGRLCEWHDGDIEPDSDFFADHDEYVNTDFHKKEYPEGFNWNCCGKDGIDARGCMKSRHKLDKKYKPGNRRPKIWEGSNNY